MRRASAVFALALAVAVAGCGDSAPERADYAARARAACPGASTGAATLRSTAGAGADDAAAIAEIERADRIAISAARALDRLTPPEHFAERHHDAVSALQSQAARLRLVRGQIDRGTAPDDVLQAARAGLTAGDRRATHRLAAIGARC